DFLPAAAADAFSLRGTPADITKQLVQALRAAPTAFEYVVLHPIPDPKWPTDPANDYTTRIAQEVLPEARRQLAES
ncbi:MAG TPA: hypothetical protein VJX92_22380, partial [Methylomirabilota bacterium]|nr:hypothetical protein [Methylomirabilota bacterium]